MATFLFEMESNRQQYMDVSTPVHISEISLLQAWPAEENRLSVLIRPFDFTVKTCRWFSYYYVSSHWLTFIDIDNDDL